MSSQPSSDNGAGTATLAFDPSAQNRGSTLLVEHGTLIPLPQISGIQIQNLIGRGSMGAVYRATQIELDRTVAVKFLTGTANAAASLERFRTEAQAIARIAHPNIVQVFDVQLAHAPPFFIMEYVDGMSLADRLEKEPLPSTREAAQIVQTLAEAMNAAHAQGIIHRDLKPANVLLADDGTPKITDFGLAKDVSVESGATEAGQIIGTPSYMAPEQARGNAYSVDDRADIYALGAILYELLAYRPPFKGATVPETLLAVMSEREVIPPRQIRPEIPQDLDTICLHCLEKDPARRYASAAALASDLSCFLNHRPILARPVTRTERVRKWVRREPHMAALVCAVMLVTVLGLVGILWQWRSAEAGWHEADVRANAEEAAKQQEAAAHTATAAALDLAERRGYVHTVALADRERELFNIQRVRDLLSGCAPTLRRWEWFSLARRSDLSLTTFTDHRGPVWSCEWQGSSPLITSAGSGTPAVFISHSATGAVTKRIDIPDLGTFRCATSACDGSLMAVSGDRGEVEITNLDTNRRMRLIVSPGQPVLAVRLTGAGETTAIGSMDGTVSVWDTVTGIRRWSVSAHERGALTVDFLPHGSGVVSGGGDGFLNTWNLNTGTRITTIPAHAGSVRSVAVNKNGTIAASAGDDGLVKLWNLPSWTERHILRGHQGTVWSVTISPDGSMVATGGNDHTVRTWNTQKGDQQTCFRGHGDRVYAVSFSEDAKRIVSGSEDRTVKVWDARRTNDALCSWREQGPILALVWRDADQILTAGGSSLAIARRSMTNPETPTLIRGHLGGIAALGVLPDGKTLVSGGKDGTVRLWNTSQWNLLRTCSIPRGAPFTLFPDGSGVLSGGVDGSLQIWEWEKKECLQTIRGHTGALRSIAISKDGSFAVSAGDDGTVRVAATSPESSSKAVAMIKGLTEEAEIGKVYQGIVKRITNFGAFCEISPGKEGLCHVSELSDQFVPRVEDVVKLGDTLAVKVVEIDLQGRINLSHKQALLPPGTPPTPPARSGGGRDQGDRGGRGGSYRDRDREAHRVGESRPEPSGDSGGRLQGDDRPRERDRFRGGSGRPSGPPRSGGGQNPSSVR